MAKSLRLLKPTSPGVRRASFPSFEEVTQGKPYKPLLHRLKKHAGRDHSGRISIRHRGGGGKRFYRLVDFSGRGTIGQSGTVEAIEYDPNRSGRLALVSYPDGKKRYLLAPQDITIGAEIVTDSQSAIKAGNRLPLAAIPTGVAIYNIELRAGKGGQLARAAGVSATIVAKDDKDAQVRLPSGEIRLVPTSCFATIGAVSNPGHSSVRLGKAGRRRHAGWRPAVRGKAMNPVDHPHGGGEGNAPIGLIHPKTPQGKPALGAKTRRPKAGDRYIIRPRRRGR